MRRPFAVIGAAFFLALLALNTLPQSAAYILPAVSAVIWILCLFVHRLRREPVVFVLCMTVIGASVLFITHTQTVNRPIMALDRQSVRITAHMRSLPQQTQDGSMRYELLTDTIAGEAARCNLVLYSRDVRDAELSDVFCLTAKVYARNDRDGERAYLAVYDDSNLICASDRPTFRSRMLAVRRYVMRTMLSSMPGTPGTVLAAMLIGDSSLIPSEVYAAMRRSGIAHIFSISGFHLSVFALSLMRTLERRKCPYFILVPICMAMVLFVMAVTGFPLSCVRAGIMIFLLLIGKLFLRRADALNSLGLAVLLMGAAQPFCAADAGLQLSVLGVLGVIATAPFAEKFARRIRIPFHPLCRFCRMLCTTAIVSACIGLFTMPVMIFTFGTVSVVAPLTNACMLFAAQWAMILASFSTALSLHFVFDFLFRPVLLLAGLCARYCTAVSGGFGRLPFAAPRVNASDAGLCIAGMLALAAAVLLLDMKGRHAIRSAAAVLLAVLTVSSAFYAWSMHSVVQVTLPDVGNSAAVLVRSRGKTALIGCGSGAAYAVSRETDRLDLVLIPDMRDAVGGSARAVLRSIPTDLLVLPARDNHNQSLYFHYSPQELQEGTYSVGGAQIEACPHSGAPSALLRIGDTSMLMLFAPSCDLSLLPDAWFGAQVLYVCGDVPAGIEAEKFGFVLVQASPQRAEMIVREIRSRGGHASSAGTMLMQDGGRIRCREGI